MRYEYTYGTEFCILLAIFLTHFFTLILGFETASGEPVEPVFKPSPYDARIYNNELVKSLEDVKSNITDQKFLVVDARSKGRFDGKAPEPRSGNKPLHTSITCCQLTMFSSIFLYYQTLNQAVYQDRKMCSGCSS